VFRTFRILADNRIIRLSLPIMLLRSVISFYTNLEMRDERLEIGRRKQSLISNLRRTLVGGYKEHNIATLGGIERSGDAEKRLPKRARDDIGAAGRGINCGDDLPIDCGDVGFAAGGVEKIQIAICVVRLSTRSSLVSETG